MVWMGDERAAAAHSKHMQRPRVYGFCASARGNERQLHTKQAPAAWGLRHMAARSPAQPKLLDCQCNAVTVLGATATRRA